MQVSGSDGENDQQGWVGVVGDFNRRVRVLEQETGLKASSTFRTMLRNAQVGGNPYSQHLIGTAADFPGLTRPGVPAFVEAARRAGLVFVDETRKTKGTGFHGHVQLFSAGQAPRALFARAGVGFARVQLSQAP